jgi:quinol monooxygenase YgiN
MSQVTNLAFLRARCGQSEVLGAALAALIEPSWLEAGCLNFVIHPAALTFSSYVFLTKHAGFAPGLLPTIWVCC